MGPAKISWPKRRRKPVAAPAEPVTITEEQMLQAIADGHAHYSARLADNVETAEAILRKVRAEADNRVKFLSAEAAAHAKAVEELKEKFL